MAVIFLFFAEFGTFAKIGVRPILSATKRVSIVITYTLCTCTPSISVSFSCIICSASLIGVATILSAVHFLLKKVDDFLFLVVALSKDGENALNLLINPPNLPRPAKNDIKIDSCSASGGGVHLVSWGALTNFPCKLRLIFFTALGGAGGVVVLR